MQYNRKNVGHPTRFRENDDLPLWRGPAVEKKPPFFSKAHALMTRDIMCSGDAQCNTGDSQNWFDYQPLFRKLKGIPH